MYICGLLYSTICTLYVMYILSSVSIGISISASASINITSAGC